MTTPELPWDGGCRCGKIRFRVDQAPLFTSVCHCRGCQLMTASVFATTLTVPADALSVTEGEPVLGGIHGDVARHYHCEWCKSWVFTRLPAEFGAVNIRATMLDDCSWFVPFVETQTDEKLPWVTTPAKHLFKRFPEPAEYPRLIGEYQAQ